MQLVRPNLLKTTNLLKSAALALALLAAAWLPGQAHAQVSVTVIPVFVPGTPNTFSYSLLNTGTETIGEFDLSVPTTSTLTNLMTPTGYLALYTPGDSFIQWLSTAATFDIPPAKTQGGFSFQSTSPAGTETYLARNSDNGDSVNGTTIGPVAQAVPEASTPVSLGLLLGLGGLLIAARRKFTRAR